MASIRIVNSIFSQNRLQILNSSRMVENVIKRYKYDKHDKHEKYKKDNKLSTSIRNEVDTNVKPLGEKVKETTKTASYMGVILLGVGVTGALFYAVFRELFSSKSPNNVYAKALKRCLEDTRVEDKLGYPITGFGEESRRRRRQHVSHVLYNRDGKQHLRMKFYLKGSVHKGTVQLEMVENDSGDYEYRYLFVEVEDLLKNTIVLEDNRNKFVPHDNTPRELFRFE